jgi:hypothetical protein
MTKLNEFQKTMLKTYAGGDYAHLVDQYADHGWATRKADEWLQNEGGDTTALALLRELEPDGDTGKAEYIARLRKTISDTQIVIAALEALPD